MNLERVVCLLLLLVVLPVAATNVGIRLPGPAQALTTSASGNLLLLSVQQEFDDDRLVLREIDRDGVVLAEKTFQDAIWQQNLQIEHRLPGRFVLQVSDPGRRYYLVDWHSVTLLTPDWDDVRHALPAREPDAWWFVTYHRGAYVIRYRGQENRDFPLSDGAFVRDADLNPLGEPVFLVGNRSHQALLTLKSDGQHTTEVLEHRSWESLIAGEQTILLDKFSGGSNNRGGFKIFERESGVRSSTPRSSSASQLGDWLVGRTETHAYAAAVMPDGSLEEVLFQLAGERGYVRDVMVRQDSLVMLVNLGGWNGPSYLVYHNAETDDSCLTNVAAASEYEQALRERGVLVSFRERIRRRNVDEGPPSRVEIGCHDLEYNRWATFLKELAERLPPRPDNVLLHVSRGAGLSLQSHGVHRALSHSDSRRMTLKVSPDRGGALARLIVDVIDPHLHRLDSTYLRIAADTGINSVWVDARGIGNDPVKTFEEIDLLASRLETAVASARNQFIARSGYVRLRVGVSDAADPEAAVKAALTVRQGGKQLRLVTKEKHRSQSFRRAVMDAQLDTARTFLAEGASPDEMEEGIRDRPIVDAARFSPLLSLLLEAGATVGDGSYDDHMALVTAIRHDYESLRLLIEAGVDVNARSGDRRTGLHIAALLNDVYAARVLIDAGADIAAQDEQGQTPLHLARRSPSVAALLLEHGADATSRNRVGQTPAHIAAAEWMGYEVLEALAEAGAPMDEVDDAGLQPWHHAEKKRQYRNQQILPEPVSQ